MPNGMGMRWERDEPEDPECPYYTGTLMHPQWQQDEYEWLSWEQHKRNIKLHENPDNQDKDFKIQHKFNGGQVKFGHYYADGFAIDPVTKRQLVFEFDGCWYVRLHLVIVVITFPLIDHHILLLF
jgi:hypothetical protein